MSDHPMTLLSGARHQIEFVIPKCGQVWPTPHLTPHALLFRACDPIEVQPIGAAGLGLGIGYGERLM